MAASSQPPRPGRPKTRAARLRSLIEVPIQRDAERARTSDELVAAGAGGGNSIAEADGTPVREVGHEQSQIEAPQVEVCTDVELVVSGHANVRLLQRLWRI